MATDPLYGWDLTFKIVEKDIKKKEDVIVAFIHWNLTKRGFRTIGIGDDHKLSGNEEESELLPDGWNTQEKYSIRYLFDNKLYILVVISNNGHLLCNLMRSEDLSVSNITFNIEESVKQMSGVIETVIPSYKDMMHNVKTNLIDALINKPTATTGTQTANESNISRPPQQNWRPQSSDHVRDDRPTYPNLWAPPEASPYNVGRSDLDPFGIGGPGGGMLFNPFGSRDLENPGLGIPGGLPRGAVPPGARFDPFAPPGAGPMPAPRRPPPDTDHLPPPGSGFSDHMFM